MDQAEINKIRKQHIARQWPKFLESISPKFLESISIDGLRGWQGQTISFDFSVCALVGENGTGKSTFLRAALCAYENQVEGSKFYPSVFFIDTYWDKITDVTLRYNLRQGNQTDSFQFTKKTNRWRP